MLNAKYIIFKYNLNALSTFRIRKGGLHACSDDVNNPYDAALEEFVKDDPVSRIIKIARLHGIETNQKGNGEMGGKAKCRIHIMSS